MMEAHLSDWLLDKRVPGPRGAFELVVSQMRSARKAKLAKRDFGRSEGFPDTSASFSGADLPSHWESEISEGADDFVRVLQLWVLAQMWCVQPSNAERERQKLRKVQRSSAALDAALLELHSGMQSKVHELRERTDRMRVDLSYMRSWIEGALEENSKDLFFARNSDDASLRRLIQIWRKTTRAEPSLTRDPRSGFLWLVREVLNRSCRGKCRIPSVPFAKYRAMVKREQWEHLLADA